MDKRAVLILGLIIMASLLVQSDYFADDLGGPHIWGENFFSDVGSNYLGKGYLPYFGMFSNDFGGYYIHHPPLFSIIISLFMLIFGTSLVALRLAPLLFSILNIILIFLIADRISNRKTALLASAIYAFLPMELYYGFHVDIHGSVLMAFMLLSVYFYINWIKTQENKFFVFMLASMALGMFTAWPAYFSSLFIFLDYMIFESRKKKNLKIFIIPALMLFCFFLFILQASALAGSFENAKDELTGVFIYRSISMDASDMDAGETFTLPQFFMRETTRLLVLFTLPAVFLSISWIVYFSVKARKKKIGICERMILILLFAALAHIFIFIQGAWTHDFWMYYLAAPIAISSSIMLSVMLNHVRARSIYQKILIFVLLILLLAIFINDITQTLRFFLKCRCSVF